MAHSIGTHIPSLAGAASEVAYPANVAANATTNNVNANVTTANTDLVNLEKIVSSFANIPSLAGMVSSLTKSPSSTTTVAYPTTLPSPPQTTGNNHTGKSGTFEFETYKTFAYQVTVCMIQLAFWDLAGNVVF